MIIVNSYVCALAESRALMGEEWCAAPEYKSLTNSTMQTDHDAVD